MQDNPHQGIALMIATTIIFAVQDGISRYLAENYNVITVVIIRYLFFMCFALAYSSRKKGGIRQVANSDQLPLQVVRGLLLVAHNMRCDLELQHPWTGKFSCSFCELPTDGHGAFSPHSWRSGWVATLAGGFRWFLRRAVNSKAGNRNV